MSFKSPPIDPGAVMVLRRWVYETQGYHSWPENEPPKIVANGPLLYFNGLPVARHEQVFVLRHAHHRLKSRYWEPLYKSLMAHFSLGYANLVEPVIDVLAIEVVNHDKNLGYLGRRIDDQVGKAVRARRLISMYYWSAVRLRGDVERYCKRFYLPLPEPHPKWEHMIARHIGELLQPGG